MHEKGTRQRSRSRRRWRVVSAWHGALLPFRSPVIQRSTFNRNRNCNLHPSVPIVCACVRAPWFGHRGCSRHLALQECAVLTHGQGGCVQWWRHDAPLPFAFFSAVDALLVLWLVRDKGAFDLVLLEVNQAVERRRWLQEVVVPSWQGLRRKKKLQLK